MNPQHFSVPLGQCLAQAVAREMARLPQSGRKAPAPVLIVDSPLAAQALKLALADTGWPGRSEGSPLPWCGTLEQGFNDRAAQAIGRHGAGLPRARAIRQAQLAQLLLDHKGIAASLGGSTKAALNLAGAWTEIFEGWEWIEGTDRPTDIEASNPGAAHLATDLSLLRALQQSSWAPNDRVAWVDGLPADVDVGGDVGGDGIKNIPAVWFCMGCSPSPRDIAMAERIWKVSSAQILVFAHEPLDLRNADALENETSPILSSSIFLSGFTPTAARSLIGATTLEETAWAAAQTILDWREQGMDDIGVVALDRKAVRRLRALLERAGEPLIDRSGWALDTTVAASAVVGLNDLLIGNATTQSVLEWVHSPFVTRALSAQWNFQSDRLQQLDASLRGFGRIATIGFAELLDQRLLPFDPAVMLPLTKGTRAPLYDWVDRLMLALCHCGLEDPLSEDAAGQAVLSALQSLQAQAGADASAISSSLWNAVLANELSEARYAEPGGQACVRVCSISSLSWQRPKALLVLGADATRLPERPMAQFFEPQRFAEMGLQIDPALVEAELLGQFVSLWSAPIPIAFVACSDKPDSDVEFSNWIELLALNEHPNIHRKKAAQVLARFELRHQDHASPQTAVAADSRWIHDLPKQLSVSQLQSLVNCSYQFYLQTLLGLQPIDALQEESPPADIGSLIHMALKGATMQQASAQQWQKWLLAEIDMIISNPFFVNRRSNPVALPIPKPIQAKLRADVAALVPPLAHWLADRSHEGVITEEPVKREIQSLGVSVQGRIDRLETTPQGQVLIDFKTTAPEELKRRVKPGDQDVQLPLYAWIIGAQHDAKDAAYVSVRRDRVIEIGVAETTQQPLTELSAAAIEQVIGELSQIASGAPVNPTGMQKDKKICAYCNVRGVCRRDDIFLTAGGTDES